MLRRIDLFYFTCEISVRINVRSFRHVQLFKNIVKNPFLSRLRRQNKFPRIFYGIPKGSVLIGKYWDNKSYSFKLLRPNIFWLEEIFWLRNDPSTRFQTPHPHTPHPNPPPPPHPTQAIIAIGFI